MITEPSVGNLSLNSLVQFDSSAAS